MQDLHPKGLCMRLLHAFIGLTKSDACRRSFWRLAAVVFLMAFAFVFFRVVTERPVYELRPILSERATVTHFNTRHSSSLIDGEAVQLFRTPDEEFPDESLLVSIFKVTGSSPLRPLGSGTATWATLLRGNLSEVHRLLLPILMAIVGVLAAPSARRSDLLRTVMPCGRWGCYGLTIAALAVRVALLSLAAAVGVLVVLPWLRGSALASLGFVLGYCGAVFAYGLGFALFGFTLAEIVRDRRWAALTALALLLVVAPWVALAQVRLDAWIAQTTSGFPALQSPSHPLYWVRSVILTPLRTTFARIPRWMLADAAGTFVITGASMPSYAQLGVQLLFPIAFWLALGGAAFSRSVRRWP
jgi:hypothetical protein